jgi:murein DD-endopeptidase MepM/ murein hydrolase activator NlpD
MESPRYRRWSDHPDFWAGMGTVLGFWSGATVIYLLLLSGLLPLPRFPGTPAVPQAAIRPAPATPATPLSRSPAGLPTPGGSRFLALPVQGISPSALRSSFTENRSGSRVHQAIDILAPRGTPVLATDDGRVVKLFTSRLGGLTLYQFDPSETWGFYYAHLDGYAPGLAEGQLVRRGDVLGYVGTTGNAPPQTPHLHFGLFQLGAEKEWWKGAPVDPYPYLSGAAAGS